MEGNVSARTGEAGAGRADLLLVNPRYPRNVGGAIRAAHCLGATSVVWSGDRVDDQQDAYEHGQRKWRLPREERMKEYRHVARGRIHPGSAEEHLRYSAEWYIQDCVKTLFTPVCVEVSDNAERLTDFIHPVDALYVFGPEDGSIPGSVKALCHRFVVIPGYNRTPLNLSAAVNVVLYDRMSKA